MLAPGEVLVVLVPASAEAEAMDAIARSAPKGGAIIAVEDGVQAVGRATHPALGVTRVSFSDTNAGWRQVFAACATASGKSSVALARRYPAIRTAAAHKVISRTAGQNALIGLAFFVPGADMPAMTLNQAKMVLRIAAMYGQPIDRERALELVAMVALGFGLRGVGRRLVRSIPGMAIVMRVATAYLGTLAVGMGAVAYFEQGAPASTSKVIALAGSMGR
jgi:uncharacterized protein (DUF697 family)